MAFPKLKKTARAAGLVLAFSTMAVLNSNLTVHAAGQENANAVEPDASRNDRGSLKIIIDRAKVVRIAKTADTIIVGNPSIVDATIQDGRTIVLTGRSFGVTNLIVLDGNGNPIVDETVTVQGHEQNTVRIYRRSVRETLACDPVCEPTLTIGDNSENFNQSVGQIESRNALSKAATEK
ncbi:MAG: pilus assembly protein N-terminal domain-containing protein [Pseudomonadota bacterium]